MLALARRLAVAALLASLAVAASATADDPGEATPAFRISVVEDGVYRVSHQALAEAAPVGSLPSASLALTDADGAVPIWIEDGGDGSFDPGDSFEFVGEHLAGDVSFYSEHSRFNVYRLALDGGGGARITSAEPAREALLVAPLSAGRHYESDAVMVRFRQRPDDPEEESWFWERLSFLEEEPFDVDLDLQGLLPGTSRLRVELRGWSRHRMPRDSEVKQHRVEVVVNDSLIAAGEWDGQEVHRIDIELEAESLRPGDNALELRVPQRVHEREEDPIVDLSLLNWIEIDYPHSGVVETGQTRLTVGGRGERRALVSAPGARSLAIFDDAGRRWFETAPAGSSTSELAVPVGGGSSSLLVVRDGEFRRAASIEIDRPSDWRRSEHRVDYLMIAHRSLLESTERLAAYHRSRGLDVAVVDVQDIYDEFNHGIVHPRAIRDFVRHAYERWRPPAPRFVLLVGDASWDVAGEEHEDESYADWSYQPREATREGFLKNRSTPYEEGPADRALIPTGSFRNAEGHAASDNYFVALEEDSFYPVLAIGRLPIVDPADLDAIVDKTIRYVEEAGVGPWRRRILWISNEDKYIQERTDTLADDREAVGFAAERVYPQKSEKSNDKHQERLLEAFGDGRLLVYFHGHGGRYIWRTGATDYRKNRDLFNLDHLDQLQPSARLPVILSMTCFSAPFDHPLADSIGEKFLRLPDRGAIAVFAASWRNAPSTDISRELVRQLTVPQTIGEAVLKAKRVTLRQDMVETYNLLGDPAVPVAAPQSALELTVEETPAGGLRLEARFPRPVDGFAGRAIVDWRGADGATLASEELIVDGDRLVVVYDEAPGEVEAATVYMWDPELGVDGVGGLSWAEPETAETADGAAGREIGVTAPSTSR